MGDRLGQAAITIIGGLLIKPIQLGLAIGSLIGGLLFPSRRRQGITRFANLQVTGSQKGDPIPVVYGTQRIAGNLLWYGNFKTIEESQGQSGKSKDGEETITRRYTAGFAIGVCEGPITDIINIWAGKDKIDMGLEGSKFRIYTGTQSQTADPYISGVLSGQLTVIANETITQPATGSTLTYTALKPPVTSGSVVLEYFYSQSGATLRQAYTVVTGSPSGDQVRLDSATAGTFTIGWPTQSAQTNLLLQYQQSGVGTLVAIPYRNTAYVTFMDWDLGQSATIPNFTFEVVRGMTVPNPASASWTQVLSGPATGYWMTRFNDQVVGCVQSQTLLFNIWNGTTWTTLNTSRSTVEGNYPIRDGTEVRPDGVRMYFWAGPANNPHVAYTDDLVTVNTLAVIGESFSGMAYWDNALHVPTGGFLGGESAMKLYRVTDLGVRTLVTSLPGPITGFGSAEPAWGDFYMGRRTASGNIYKWDGSIWTMVWSHATHTVNNLVYDSQTDLLLAATTGGIWTITKSGTSAQRVLNTNISNLARTPNGYLYAAISQAGRGLLYSTDAITWGETTSVSSDFQMLDVDQATAGDKLFVMDNDGSIYSDAGQNAAAAATDINPVDALDEFLRNTRYGPGITTAQNSPSWSDTKTYVSSQDLLVSPIIADRRRALEHVEHLLSYFDGFMSYSQGNYRLGARRADETAVVALTDADYIAPSMPEYGKLAQRETRNRLRLEWANRADDYNRSIAEAYDDWSITDTGERQESIALIGVTRPSVAQKWVQRALWSRLTERILSTIKVGPKRTLIEPGDVVTMTHSEIDFNARRFRVTTISEAPEKTYALQVIEEPTGTLQWPNFLPQSVQITDPRPGGRVSPGDTIAAVFEWPAELPAQYDANIPLIGIAATGANSTWGGADIHLSRDGTTYTLASQLRRRATLGYATTAFPAVPMMGLYDDECGQVTIDLSLSRGTVDGVGREDMLAAGRLSYLGGEFLSFQSATLTGSYTYQLRSMLRGMYDSDVRSKGSGNVFFRVDDNVKLFPITRDDIGKPIYLKLPSVGIFGDVQDISSVQAFTFTPQGIRLQPDPVVGLQEDNLRGADVTDQRTLTFVWRYGYQTNVEDVEINSGVVTGSRAPDFLSYVANMYTATSSVGPWTVQTIALVGSESFTWVASGNAFQRIDVQVRDTSPDDSPPARRVVQVLGL